jgi:hypothetical protein
VTLRECPSDLTAYPAALSFEVPAAPWAAPACLEAIFEPAQPVGDWQRKTLSVAAHVASLLVQLEQASGRSSRPQRDDGAAPLIGSSVPIRLVRERIERVAVTDFTVLIEGGSGPQPHAGVIGIFGQASVHDSDRKVAGAEAADVRPASG